MPLIDFTGELPYDRHSSVFRPLVPVRFINPNNGAVLEKDGLVDTGADTSLVTLESLRLLGFELASLRSRQTIGTAGMANAYEVELIMQVCGASFTATVVAPQVEALEYHLLGRDPLFRHAHFAFEEYDDPRRNRILWKLP
jgi:predicted aspartyl protease